MLKLADAFSLNPGLNPNLFLPDPKDVLASLERAPVKDWLEFIAQEHLAPPHRILLFTPCTPRKPYDPPRDQLHAKLLELEQRYDLYLVSVSEPLGLEPREFWSFSWRGINLIYDAPFFPWIQSYGYRWDWEIASKVWEKLSRVAGEWYSRNSGKFQHLIGFATPQSSYRRILAQIPVQIWVPDFEPQLELSYWENTDKLYIQPRIWDQLMEALESL